VLDQITRLLAATTASGSFATRRLGDAEDLRIDVKGVGPIPLPVPEPIARRLCEVAQPARYGLRDQTLLDARVRAAWEIDRGRVKIDARRWRQALAPQLVQIGRDLGVPAGGALRAELHNLLVYGPGQFFAPHQDSEKADGMVGTLVVMLPSTFRGGGFVIEHHDEQVRYGGSRDRLSLVAFYADCRHEVERVTSGYRVVLTYNLLLDGVTAAGRSPIGRPVEAMVRHLRDYFATPRPENRLAAGSEGPPDRLVYLLDHEYTQSGLGWQGLKNGDAARAALLRACAARLDCEIALALADVHEVWSCEDDYDGGRSSWGRRRWRDDDDDDDDDGDDGGDGDHTLVELCDSDLELRHWVGATGERLTRISGDVSDADVCFTTASVDLEPFKSEHEGYTGNAGNTVERWYHRAAVVLWPRARAFAIGAKGSPAWAVRELGKVLARGEVAAGRAMATQLRPFWSRVAERELAAGFIDSVLRVAALLDDRELAATLAAPIALERLTPRMAPRLAALVDRYGLAWCTALIDRWAPHRSWSRDGRWAWLARLSALCEPLCAGGGADQLALARHLARSQWAIVEAELAAQLKRLPSRAALASLVGLGAAIVGVLETTAIAADADAQRRIIEALSDARGYPVRAAIAALRAAQGPRGPAELAGLGLAAVHDDCTRTLTRRIEAPVRAADDWSIATPIRCGCALCKQLVRFLRARAERELAWPLASEQRAHVHGIVAAHELPLTHQTRRTGRPYSLILVKTRALFAGEASERAASSRDLAWLSKTARSFSSQPARSGKRGSS
jgi:hypothetical protein